MHSRITSFKVETLIMRLNIQKLRNCGFEVSIDKDNIEIHATPLSEAAWQQMRDQIAERIGDPGLQDYVMGSYMTALQRAQILEIAE